MIKLNQMISLRRKAFIASMITALLTSLLQLQCFNEVLQIAGEDYLKLSA
jgi:hypothetical protein